MEDLIFKAVDYNDLEMDEPYFLIEDDQSIMGALFQGYDVKRCASQPHAGRCYRLPE